MSGSGTVMKPCSRCLTKRSTPLPTPSPATSVVLLCSRVLALRQLGLRMLSSGSCVLALSETTMQAGSDQLQHETIELTARRGRRGIRSQSASGCGGRCISPTTSASVRSAAAPHALLVARGLSACATQAHRSLNAADHPCRPRIQHLCRGLVRIGTWLVDRSIASTNYMTV